MPVGSNWAIYPPSGTPPALLRWESRATHFQCSAEEAALKGWYWRPVRYGGLIPDTRRCMVCGKTMFEPLVLTDDEKAMRHPLSTNVLLGTL